MAKDPLEPLFAAPLDDFVATRNRIAAELRKAGDRELADTVKAMRKPPAVVWALNRLAREHADDVDGLLKLTEAMRAVQSGRSDASFADAQRALVEAARGLAATAAALLESAGTKPSAALSQRLGRALTAAAASPETSELLRAGRLVEEPEAVGFGGIDSVAPRPRRASRGDAARARREAAKAEREAAKEAARLERLETAKRALREAKADAARLSREAEQAQERVVELERRVARLG